MPSTLRVKPLYGSLPLFVLLCSLGLSVPSACAQVVAQDTPFVPRAAREVKDAIVVDILRCKPDYPRASVLAEEQGSVTLGFTVAANGEVSDLAIVHSSGFKNLDRATFNILKDCQFRPLTVEGQAYRSTSSVVYVWRLKD